MTTPLTLGDAIRPGQLVPCPQCTKRHRVRNPEEGKTLDFIRCKGELLVVGIEGRFLPCSNSPKP